MPPGIAARLAGGCGDFPLALRIVAAQLVNRAGGSPAELADRLGGGPEQLAELTLEGGSVSVRKAFDATYRDLSPAAARLFRLLALVPSRRVGLDHSVAMSGLPPAVARPAVEELAGLHLLAGADPGRYSWHDLIRSYAQERAVVDEPAASRAAAIHRLVDYLLAGTAAADRLIALERRRVVTQVATPAGTELPGSRQAALGWLDGQLPVVLAVASCAGEFGRPEAAWQLACLLGEYCILRGRYVELAEACEHGLASVVRTGTAADEAAVRQSLAVAYLSTRRLADALAQVQRALALFESVDDQGGASRARNNLGVIRRLQRRYPEALAVFQEALARRGDARDDNVAVLLNNIGEVYTELGEPAQAVRFLDRALAVRVELGDRYGEGITLLNLGDLALRRGDYPAAGGRLGEAVAALREAGARHAQAMALTQLGEAARRQESYREAVRHLRTALLLLAETGDRHGEADTRAVLAATLLDTGDRAGARHQLELVRELRLTHPDPLAPAREQELVDELTRRLAAHTERIPDS
jgi:tetratricopeptide (TPR) repeat protein